LIYQVIMNLDTPTNTVLYSIEEAIKAYRKLCQKNISQIIPDITVDQGLILMMLDNTDKTQSEIADLIFKDYASMTRIIKLMINKNYLIKTTSNEDKRKVELHITNKGKKVLKQLAPIIQENRNTALNNISEGEMEQLYKTLRKITNNCKAKI